MLSKSDNERMTRVGRGTPMGEMLRRYWLPALMSAEVAEPDGAPVRVQLLGERLLAFRDTEGRVGLFEEFCPHRRASLYYGRNEDCGLRCVYHGWKFNREGVCVDLPSEPPHSLFKEKIRIPAYPTFEAGGLIWAYLGPTEAMPPAPRFVWTQLPPDQRMVAKVLYECNYVQAVENEIDLMHGVFLHRRLSDEPGQSSRSRSGLSPSHPLVKNPPYEVAIQPTVYGFRNIGKVPLGEGKQAIHVQPVVMPFYSFTPRMPGEEMLFHAYVPRDDFSTWSYDIHFSLEHAIDPEVPIEWRGLWVDERYRKLRNVDNDYLLDREVMQKENFSGILGISNQDSAVIESMGPIVDRSLERLGTSDRSIIAYRQMLLKSLDRFQTGGVPFSLEQGFPYEKIWSKGSICKEDAEWQEACPLEAEFRRPSEESFVLEGEEGVL